MIQGLRTAEQLAGASEAALDDGCFLRFELLRRRLHLCKEVLELTCPSPTLDDRQELLATILQRLRTAPLLLALLCFPLTLAAFGFAFCLFDQLDDFRRSSLKRHSDLVELRLQSVRSLLAPIPLPADSVRRVSMHTEFSGRNLAALYSRRVPRGCDTRCRHLATDALPLAIHSANVRLFADLEDSQAEGYRSDERNRRQHR